MAFFSILNDMWYFDTNWFLLPVLNIHGLIAFVNTRNSRKGL